ncbi:MAG: 4-(cytidine 5'-diphospho)-2-C-methyl-D-erythritol kinase [Firmicutes bacterium]|nr:4-(cytidine 5'-diphospho)-2-C-methyl-D-erythritol kinase [Bacillota bacterium]
MKIHAYAKINLILNVLGERSDGYHEVEMLMQAVSLCDEVTVEASDASGAADRCDSSTLLGPQDFEYGQNDLAYRAALLMAETFRPELLANALDKDGLELAPGVRGIRVAIEKHIPAAAGLGGGSADAAAVLVGLGKLWLPQKTADDLPEALLPLGAKLGSDVPFCIASQLGHPAAIARGRGTELEFVQPVDCGVDLYFSDVSIPGKTRAVYAELKDGDCKERFSIEGLLNASSLEEKLRFVGNHLQAPAERLFRKAENDAESAQPNISCRVSCADASRVSSPAALANTQAPTSAIPADATLCGAGPTYFTLSETGTYRTVVK